MEVAMVEAVLVGKSEVFIKYEAEVSSRVGGGERGVVDFGKLLLRPMSRNSDLPGMLR